jgi:LPS export ABC transporter protein LptC
MLTSFQALETQAIGFLELFKSNLLFWGIILFLITSCEGVSEHDRAAIQQALADSTYHNSETWGVTMDLMEDGIRFVSIQSPYAITTENKDESTTILYGPVYIEVRDNEGNPETYVSSGRAVYWSRTSEFYLDGNVVVDAPGNQKLTTPALTWYQFKREIEAEGIVTIVTPTDSIVGTGLIGDDRLESYTIGKVSGTFTINNDQNDSTRTDSKL